MPLSRALELTDGVSDHGADAADEALYNGERMRSAAEALRSTLPKPA